jgi:hypothetical protein
VSAQGQAVAKPSVILKRGLLRIGVLSVLSPEAFSFDTAGYARDLSFEDPTEAVRREAKALRDQVDVLVALSHLGADGDARLAQAVPELDVVIGAHTGRALHVAETYGNTILAEAGRDGAFLGVLRLKLDDGHISGHSNRLISLDSSIPEDGSARAVVDEWKASQSEAFTATLAASEALAPEFRARSCGECHPRELSDWQESGHSQALATLASAGEDRNPSCWPCHSTGVRGQEARLPNVQCLACHDVGAVENGKHARLQEEPVQGDSCLPCHTPMRSPNFRFDRYRAFVAHAK